MAATGEDVYCTLMLSDSYLPGAIVLAHSLRDGGTKKKLACMVTLDTLSTETVTRLKELYDYILPVPRIANTKPANLYLMNRGDLLYAFTKIHLWRLDQFRKIVYIDSDVVALTAPDELFDIDAPFAAAPDIGWPDAFNSGVMVLTPDRETFGEIKELADSSASFDGADQGLLNQYYEPRGWHRLSFTYNTTPNAQYQWEPAYRHYKDSIKMVHFIGRPKPWTLAPPQGGSETYNELLGHWWTVWNRHNQTADVDADPHHRAAAEFARQGKYGAVGGSESGSSQRPTVLLTRPSDDGSTSELWSPHDSNQSDEQLPQSGASDAPKQPEAHNEPGAPETHSHPEDQSHAQAEATSHRPQSPSQQASQQAPHESHEASAERAPEPFVAPAVQWDATRAPPPQNAPPEAANFPNQEYAFSSSNQLFSAPASYPAPPKDMWYEVPSPPVTAPPAPIFPWERKSRPPPSRVFADADNAPEAVYIPPPVLPRDADEVDYSFAPPEDAPQAQIVHQAAVYQTQEAFSPQANAWDNMTGIERYVRAVMDTTGAGGRRNSSKPTSIDLSGVRRGSLILTAFPSADERPSLPVTPAPRRRGTFWGPGGGSGGDGEVGDEREPLKQAEGVPDQIDWVCPRCGFSSDDAMTFVRERGEEAVAEVEVEAELAPESGPEPELEAEQPKAAGKASSSGPSASGKDGSDETDTTPVFTPEDSLAAQLDPADLDQPWDSVVDDDISELNVDLTPEASTAEESSSLDDVFEVWSEEGVRTPTAAGPSADPGPLAAASPPVEPGSAQHHSLPHSPVIPTYDPSRAPPQSLSSYYLQPRPALVRLDSDSMGYARLRTQPADVWSAFR